MRNDEDFLDERIPPLIADLTQIAMGWRPDDQTLENAPLLEDWRWATDPDTGDTVLEGVVTGHPILRGIRTIRTSPVMAYGVTGRWARTVSRFYRLGRARHV